MKNQLVAFLNLRTAGKSEKNVTVRTKQRGFDEFIYLLLDLLNFIDYRIPILPIEIVACTFEVSKELYAKRITDNDALSLYLQLWLSSDTILNFRPFTRTADYPHWWMTRTLCY